VDRGTYWTFSHRFGIEYYMTYTSHCTWNWMCNGFKNAREHYTVGIYYIYIILILLHCYASTFRPSAVHDSIYTVIKPIVSFRILTIAPTYRVRPRHLFFASLCIEKRPACLPTVWQWRRRRRFGFPGRSCFYVYAERLPAAAAAAAQCDLQEYAAAP